MQMVWINNNRKVNGNLGGLRNIGMSNLNGLGVNAHPNSNGLNILVI